MEQGHIDRIVSCYGGAGEFKVNRKYSRPHETVYTKDGDKYHWLIVEQKYPGSVEVRQTDGHGKIPKGARCHGMGRCVPVAHDQRRPERSEDHMKAVAALSGGHVRSV